MTAEDLFRFRILVGLALGLVGGSFATMLVHRVPRGLSIVSPPSACPQCGIRLRARDLIPLLSWLIARGRCRHCGKPIGLRYLFIELAFAALGVGLAVAM